MKFFPVALALVATFGGALADNACQLPSDAADYTVVTKGDATIGAHSIYKGLAIGGELIDGSPNQSATVDKTMSQINNIGPQTKFNFNGGLVTGSSSVADNMQGRLEYLAKNAKSSSSGGYKVIVKNSGGTFNTYEKTSDGRQFGPTIIAPWSRVTVRGDAGFVDGSIYCNTLVTTGGNQGQLQLHGDTYHGPIECAESTPIPTEPPTKQPTAAPTSSPTAPPTNKPTARPTNTPTKAPTNRPTASPANKQTVHPTNSQTKTPSPTTVPRNAGMLDDPHVLTWNGTWFDMGECDLVLLHAPAFHNGMDLDIHVRTTIRYEYSFISAAVLRIGDDTLEVSSWGDYSLNEVIGADPKAMTVAGFPVVRQQPNKKHTRFELSLGDSEKIVLSTFKDFVSISIKGGEEKHFGGSVGMMGSFRGGQLLARDGVTVMEEPNAFGQEWQVRGDEPMLFGAWRSPQAPREKCILPGAKTATKRRRLGETRISKEAAEAACSYLGAGAAFEACVADVVAAGDVDIAKAGGY